MGTNIPISACKALQEALTDRTRGLIFHEFLVGGELTASMISTRLGLTFTNTSYHIRRLVRSGIIEPTREVVAGYRTEKFYRIMPALVQVLRATPRALTETFAEMTPEERQTLHCTYLAIAATMLSRASGHYQSLPPEEFDELFSQQRLLLLGLGTVRRQAFEQIVRVARGILVETWSDIGADTPWEYSDYMIFAALPQFIPHAAMVSQA